VTDAETDVRAALSALAADDAGASTVDTETIDEAVAALDDVRDAAAFVADGGLPRLRRAIDRADRAGDDAAVRRGRDALDAIERCRRVAADHF
jgi:putative heme degradation protein